eukprot:1159584-Pelagomonas_calceolata.AAC.17
MRVEACLKQLRVWSNYKQAKDACTMQSTPFAVDFIQQQASARQQNVLLQADRSSSTSHHLLLEAVTRL